MVDSPPGGFMDILAAIRREERKREKQLGKLQHQLSGEFERLQKLWAIRRIEN
jgi:hypothetical protein